ncbi:MAG TPA: hypothetical protein VM074_00415 [Solimonas sp.]|nr:hypothetical protein [Solimonas sp.]
MNIQPSVAPRFASAASLLLLLALASGAAQADPPYGGRDFDAPGNFVDAVLISPNAPASAYAGMFEVFPLPDIDYYKFSVSQGQDISISCTQFPYPNNFSGTQDVRHPCLARLLDPSGADQSAGISSDGFSAQITYKNAYAGDWRLEISGVDVAPIINECVPCEEPTYYFSVLLTPAGADANGGGGGCGFAGSLLLAVAALLRRRRYFGPGVAAVLLPVLSVAAFAGPLDDPADLPIQPGAPKYVHGGPTNGTPLGICTLNFVFQDAQSTYIGAAGHCSLVVGERETAPEIGKFGTVVFRVSCRVQVLPDSCPDGGPQTDDFALIRVDADKLALVSPVMRGVGAAPTGFTIPGDTLQGDLLAEHTQGLPGGAVPATRTQTGVFVSDDELFFDSTLVGLTDSGSPVLHMADGKALGIVTTSDNYGNAGPTIERVLELLAEAGFEVALVTADSIESSGNARSAERAAGGALPLAPLLALASLALGRRMAASFRPRPGGRGGLALAGLLMLSACGSGPGGSFSQEARDTLDPAASHRPASMAGLCRSLGGGRSRVRSHTTGCLENPLNSLEAAMDGDNDSYALLRSPSTSYCPDLADTTIQGQAQAGVVFPSGIKAGALISVPPGGMGSAFFLTVTTFLEGIQQDSGRVVTKVDLMDTRSSQRGDRLPRHPDHPAFRRRAAALRPDQHPPRH